jgi:carbamoyl-phosphate synthase small subunit
MVGKDYVREVTCTKPYEWFELPWSLNLPKTSSLSQFPVLTRDELGVRPHLVVIDCGVKRSILRLLLEAGFRVTVVPATTIVEDILELCPDALFVSNGPGDPAAISYVVDPIKKLIGRIPMFGICLGHQIIGQALGGKTYKLKFGHRGGNHPVLDTSTGKVEITVQNHGFALAQESLAQDFLSYEIIISHINLNDQTVEGLSVPDLGILAVQYHPEASPGPHDSAYLFNRFYRSVTANTSK